MNMQELPPELAAMLMGGKKKKERILDKIDFPRDKTRTLLELLQKVYETKDGPGNHRAQIEMWRFIYSAVPAVRDMSVTLNTSNARVPMLHVTGKNVNPTVGNMDRHNHKILRTWEIGGEDAYRLMELSDMTEAGPLHRFELWDFIATLIPYVAENPGDNYAICVDAHWTGVYQTEEGDDDDD